MRGQISSTPRLSRFLIFKCFLQIAGPGWAFRRHPPGCHGRNLYRSCTAGARLFNLCVGGPQGGGRINVLLLLAYFMTSVQENILQ